MLITMVMVNTVDDRGADLNRLRERETRGADLKRLREPEGRGDPGF